MNFLLILLFAVTPFGPFWGSSQVPSITVPLNWVEDDCSHCPTCNVTGSQNQAITVPIGSSGVVHFSIPEGSVSYSTNGGTSYSSLTNGQTVTFSNGNTIKFKSTAILDGSCSQVILTDNVTGAFIGGVIGWNACNTATGCP